MKGGRPRGWSEDWGRGRGDRGFAGASNGLAAGGRGSGYTLDVGSFSASCTDSNSDGDGGGSEGSWSGDGGVGKRVEGLTPPADGLALAKAVSAPSTSPVDWNASVGTAIAAPVSSDMCSTAVAPSVMSTDTSVAASAATTTAASTAATTASRATPATTATKNSQGCACPSSCCATMAEEVRALRARVALQEQEIRLLKAAAVGRGLGGDDEGGAR